MMGLRDGGARRSKLARGVAASTCTIVGTMMVKFVRPRPMVLVQLSVSMGRKGKITMPPIGPNSSLKSFAERSGLNLARLMLRLSKGSSSRTLLLAALEDAFFIGWISPFTVICVRGAPFPRRAGEGVGLRAKRLLGRSPRAQRHPSHVRSCTDKHSKVSIRRRALGRSFSYSTNISQISKSGFDSNATEEKKVQTVLICASYMKK